MQYANKFLLLIALSLLIALPGMAQDLDSTAVSDQYDSGQRGNESGSCGIVYGGACVDGSDAVIITDTDGVTGSISYVNTWAGASSGDAANGESPVVDITAAHVQPDRNTSWSAISANSRPGATSPNNALLICDDGGHNGIFWGEADDKNYFIEADVYCSSRSGELTEAQYEAVSVCIRAASREGSWIDYTFNMDRTGSYAIVYDEILDTIEAVTWARNLLIADVTTREATSKVVHATISNPGDGWHTFRIDARGSRIAFFVDGATMADVIDSTYDAGYAGLVLREGGVDAAQERPGYFDNMKSGPSQLPVPAVTGLETQKWEDYK